MSNQISDFKKALDSYLLLGTDNPHNQAQHTAAFAFASYFHTTANYEGALLILYSASLEITSFGLKDQVDKT